MANMNLLEESYKFKYITSQRVFSSNRLDNMGKFPLATSFEVMLSIFQYGDKSIEESIDFILNFLNLALDCSNTSCIYLLPSVKRVEEHLQVKNIDSSNLIKWNNTI